MLNHSLLHLYVHGISICLQHVFSFVNLANPHEVIAISMVEVTLTRNWQVRIYTLHVVIIAHVGFSAAKFERDGWATAYRAQFWNILRRHLGLRWFQTTVPRSSSVIPVSLVSMLVLKIWWSCMFNIKIDHRRVISATVRCIDSLTITAAMIMNV